MVQVSFSASFTFKMEDLKRWRTGFTKETMTYFSLESASVNSDRGLRDLLMASRTSVSCQVGMRRPAFLSSDKTWEIALCCSRTLSLPALIPTLWDTWSSVYALEASVLFVPLLAPFYVASCKSNCLPAFCRDPLLGQTWGSFIAYSRARTNHMSNWTTDLIINNPNNIIKYLSEWNLMSDNMS